MSKINYLDNDEFVKELVKHKAACKAAIENNQDLPVISNYLGKCFLLLVENIAKKADYHNYPHQVLEVMMSDAVLNCLTVVNSFNPEKSKNAFGYFTMIIHRAFWRAIEKERTRLYNKYKLIENCGVLDEEGVFDDSDGTKACYESYDNISEYIKTYEMHQEKKKRKKANTNSKLEHFFE